MERIKISHSDKIATKYGFVKALFFFAPATDVTPKKNSKTNSIITIFKLRY